MPTFAELISRADALVRDSDLTDTIGDLINQGAYEIAGGMPSVLDGITDPIPNILTAPLPELFTIGTVTTSLTDAFVDMPDDFQRNLQLVVSASGTAIEIEHSFIELTETYPMLDKVGNISTTAEHGRKLYYQGIPSTEEIITLHYYRKPVIMIDDVDEPDGIPEHLQMALLTNFAAWKAYEFIEDGLEGETPNTQKYMGLFFTNLRTLELSIPDYTRGLALR